MTNSIFVPQNSAWTIVGRKRIASQHWWFCWNFKDMKLTWEVNSHSLQITQEEGILWTTATKRYLWGETTQFTGFYHCFVKKSCRNIEQVTTGVVPSDTIRYPDAHSQVTWMYHTKFGTKEKTLIWKTLTFTSGYIFSGSLSIWSYASCLEQFAAPWGI